ncbi:MAG TPA: hypothetical protein VEF76_00985 [Patescibacteria group bacterium]|nr:hypothetical protein [Patescibacteria group bacterium]
MKSWPVLVLCLFAAACAKRGDTRIAYDNSNRIALEQQAKAGDPVAQFNFGESFCCGDSGFYDTAEAERWWCRSAAQGYAPAQQRVAERAVTCNAE